MDILPPNFAKPIVYQQYSGICRKNKFAPFFFKKWAKKRFFRFPIMANYGQLWPNYDREVNFFLEIQNATKSQEFTQKFNFPNLSGQRISGEKLLWGPPRTPPPQYPEDSRFAWETSIFLGFCVIIDVKIDVRPKKKLTSELT